MRKDTRQLVEWAEGLGWQYEGVAKSGHVRLRHEQTGRSYRIPSTPSDGRSVANTKADLRRLGRNGA